MKKSIKYLIGVVLIGVVGVLFYNKVYIPKTTFKTIHPTKGRLQVTTQGIGNVSAQNIYVITAQTAGKILSIKKDEGEWVTKGELLVEMDGVDLPEQLAAAQATLQKAQFDIKASQDELLTQKAQKKLLEITYKRYERLKAQRFASQAEYDKAKADLDGMNATIDATIARIGSAKAGAVVAMKNIDAIETKIERLKVYAPVDGYIISKDAEVSQNVLSVTPILQIVDTDTLWVETKVDEKISAQIEVGQSATIKLRSQPDRIYRGVVKRIDAMSDAVTLEREIDVAFVNLPKPFYMNEQAEVEIAIETFEDVIKIPSKLTVQNEGKIGVWLLKNSKASFQILDIIAQNDDAVALKEFSLSSQIIVPDKDKKPLKNGMKIHQ